MAAILVPSSPQPPLPLFSGLPILLSLVKSGLAANKKASVVGIVAASAAAVAGVALFLVNRNLNSRYAIPGYSRTAEIACLARYVYLIVAFLSHLHCQSESCFEAGFEN